MRLGDVANAGAAGAGKPLDGVRILALEQMQALPYATQLLARLGADVVKVENPKGGDSGRGSLPAMADPEGRDGRRHLPAQQPRQAQSICVDLKAPAGRDLVLRLAPQFDVVAENFKAGAMARLGLGYADVAAGAPRRRSTCRCPGSGTPWPRRTTRGRPSHRSSRPCRASTSSSGRATTRRWSAPVGALGDIGSGLFAVIGVLAALRHRDATGVGQHVDIAMLDAMVAMTDLVTNFWSLGLRNGALAPLIMHGFRAADGWFIIQVGREHQFAMLAELVGQPELGRRPALRRTARAGSTTSTASSAPPSRGGPPTAPGSRPCEAMSAAGIAAGPCFRDDEVVADPARRRPQHARRGAPHRRRRPAGARPRQPGEDDQRRRGPGDPDARGSASTPTPCCRGARPRPMPRWPISRCGGRRRLSPRRL